jgi:site-specific DNA-adenine methylase
MAPKLVSFMPAGGKTYVEPFAGRGNVFFAAALNRKFHRWRLNDVATAPFFEALRDCGAEIRVPERTREEFYKQKRCFEEGDPQAVLLEPFLTFSGGGYKKGGFGGARGATAESYAETLRRCSRLLRRTAARISAADWKALKLQTLTEDDFVFLDPPYYGADVRAYSSGQFDYEGLVGLLQHARFRWLLTEYRQPFYVKKLGEPFYQREVQLACTKLGKVTRTRIECCWRNY